MTDFSDLNDPPLIDKDPAAVLDYELNWATWLAGDTITSVTWTVPAGINKDSATNTVSAATIWLSGGTDKTTYEIGCSIVTAGGRTDARTILVHVIDR